MKKEHWIVAGATFFGLLVWIFDAWMDSLFFYEDSFLNLVLFNMPLPELFFRVQVLVFFTIFGFIISSFFSGQRKAEAALQKMYAELEKRIQERTQELSQANEQLTTEIEERRQAEKNLNQNQKMLQTIFDGIAEPLILMDQDRRMKMMNKTAAAYYGLPAGSFFLNAPCHQVLRNSAVPCQGCDMPADLTAHRSFQFERRGFMNPERTEIVHLYPVKIEENHGYGILMRIGDVTEQRIFEQQLIQNEKMAALGVLISSVAHEINNPVNFISFNLPILRNYMEELLPLIDDYAKRHSEYEIYHMPYAEFRKDLLNLIDNLDHGAERIKAVVSNLKEFNRANYVVQEKRVDLNRIIQNVLQANRLRALKKINVFEKKIPEDLPKVWSDPYAIEQIIVNLLTNAAHACDKETSKVTLNIEIQQAWQERIVITVKDNGMGMSEETRRKIFDPFFTTKSVVGGTGLGLFVCQGLVQKLEGRIEVESEPGEGATFTVLLPDKHHRNLNEGRNG